MMNWDDLRYFLAVVEAGTLSGAARHLHVEHTTVSRRIDAFEKSLALRLFDRLANGWALTIEGRDLLNHARDAEARFHSFERAAQSVNAETGMVRISAPPTLASILLAPQMGNLLKALPQIDIELLGESREASLIKGEADIALRMFRPTSGGLAIKSLATIHYGIYATERYLQEHAPSEWEFVGYDASLSDAPQQKWLEKIAAGRRFVMRSNDQMTLFQAAATNLGITVLPHYLARPGKIFLPVDGIACPIARTLWLTVHEDTRRSPRIRAVADHLIALFASEAMTKQLS